MLNAVDAQRTRIHGNQTTSERWDAAAQRFRGDPHRQLNANMEFLASCVKPEDVLLDVGGGAGRMSLPLALRCREAINVDTSAAMLTQFAACAAEAGINNAWHIHGDWLEVESPSADVALSTHVVYFVRDIRSFIEKLQGAARRRVVIGISNPPPPNRTAQLFRLVYGEDQAMVPTHRELLPVIWGMAILPDVKIMPPPSQASDNPTSKDAAIEQALGGSWLGPNDKARGRQVLEAHFDELFTVDGESIFPRWRPEARDMFITWETN
jgi:ubiquinone/menaquinone biosynthesis C-methylase UbiE